MIKAIKHMAIVATAICSTAFVAPAAEASCLKGAVIGGVAGHFMNHHAVAGAAAGCAVGHYTSKRAKKTHVPTHHRRYH